MGQDAGTVQLHSDSKVDLAGRETPDRHADSCGERHQLEGRQGFQGTGTVRLPLF